LGFLPAYRRPEEGKRSFEESIRVAPTYDQAYLNLARVYAIEGTGKKAKAVLLELLKQHPDHAQAKKIEATGAVVRAKTTAPRALRAANVKSA